LNNADAPSIWTPIGADKNIIKELNIALTTQYQAKGYLRISSDSKTKLQEENWFIWKAS
jgi:hypothetical protein